MGEKEPKASKGTEQWVKTDLSLEDYIAQSVRPAAAPRQAPRQAPSQSPYPRGGEYRRVRPDFTSPHPSAERVVLPHKRLSGRKKLAIVAMVTAGVLGVSGVSYVADFGGVRTTLSAEGGAAADDLTITPPEALGEKSLAPDQCTDPDAVLMAVMVDGYLPLVPELATATSATPVEVKPYMTEANKNKLPDSKQDKFEKFITEDGYLHATLNNIPLTLTACEPTDKQLIIPPPTKDGLPTIDRSALQLSFEDPAGEFHTSINAASQVKGADVPTDPKAGEYMTLPNPADNMFLGQDKDETFNKGLTELTTNMKSAAQMQVILATMEIQAIQQIDNVVDGQKNIEYPDGAKTLQQAIDAALIQRLGGKYNLIGNYGITVDVPKDPKTKQPITSNDPATGASPLKNLDPTQKFHITSAKVINGSIKVPTPKPTPTESTPTPTPTK